MQTQVKLVENSIHRGLGLVIWPTIDSPYWVLVEVIHINIVGCISIN